MTTTDHHARYIALRSELRRLQRLVAHLAAREIRRTTTTEEVAR